MVVIQVKNSDHDTFLYETNCDVTNDALVRDMVQVWNLRIRLRQLAGGLHELAQHGPMKPPDKAGIDDIQERYNQERIDKGEFYNPDPTGTRTGNGLGPQLSSTMEQVTRDVESVLDKVCTLLWFSFLFSRTAVQCAEEDPHQPGRPEGEAGLGSRCCYHG